MAAEPRLCMSHPPMTSRAPNAKKPTSHASGAPTSSRTWCTPNRWWSTMPSTKLTMPHPARTRPEWKDQLGANRPSRQAARLADTARHRSLRWSHPVRPRTRASRCGRTWDRARPDRYWVAPSVTHVTSVPQSYRVVHIAFRLLGPGVIRAPKTPHVERHRSCEPQRAAPDVRGKTS